MKKRERRRGDSVSERRRERDRDGRGELARENVMNSDKVQRGLKSKSK